MGESLIRCARLRSGSSGCGKTPLLKILADVHQADDGGAQIGNPTSHFAPRGDVGMVFQQPLRLKWHRILDNVMLTAEILRIPRTQAMERAQ